MEEQDQFFVVLSKYLEGKTKEELIAEGHSRSTIDKVIAVHDNARRKQFEGSREVDNWIYEAEGLKWAADRLYDFHFRAGIRNFERMSEGGVGTGEVTGEELLDFRDLELISKYYLLIGYAFENLLKGIYITQNPEIMMESDRLPSRLQTHNLIDLVEESGLDINSEERSLLLRLTICTTWLGKYPVPLRLRDMLPRQEEDGNWIRRGEVFRGYEAKQEVDSLFSRFLNEFRSQRPTTRL